MFPCDIFITCSHGLEPLLTDELQELGYHRIKPGFRGVYVEGIHLTDIYKINYMTRIGGRVLLPLARFKCFDQKGLYRGVYGVDWKELLPPGRNFAIDSNVSHRMINNSHFAALVAKDAICDQLRERTGRRPSINVKDPDVQLNLFVHDREGVISLDTSGAPLYKRGYRIQSVEAPIQESLAAALLRISQYNVNEQVIDPCCGSGTLLIEAALIATNTPPGFLKNQWGFMNLPQFSSEEWLKVKNEADSRRTTMPKGKLTGIDINQAAHHAAKVNSRAAGMHAYIDWVQNDFREYIPKTSPNFLITNPPHGKRLESADYLVPLYRSLGDFMKRQLSLPGKGFIFTSNLDLAKEVGLAPKKRHVMSQSGEECRFLEFDIF